jgi:transketolase
MIVVQVEPLTRPECNTIRTFSIGAVQLAKSGHPGHAHGACALGYTIWKRVMQFDPGDPIWPNRDRFVLSNATPRCFYGLCFTSRRHNALIGRYRVLKWVSA